MKKNFRFVNLILFVCVTGALALTASAFAVCGTPDPDEFLDLAQARQEPILPILPPHWHTHPSFFLALTTFPLPVGSPLAGCLRC